MATGSLSDQDKKTGFLPLTILKFVRRELHPEEWKGEKDNSRNDQLNRRKEKAGLP